MSDPELRRAEMKRISEVGVKGIKVDFLIQTNNVLFNFIRLY